MRHSEDRVLCTGRDPCSWAHVQEPLVFAGLWWTRKAIRKHSLFFQGFMGVCLVWPDGPRLSFRHVFTSHQKLEGSFKKFTWKPSQMVHTWTHCLDFLPGEYEVTVLWGCQMDHRDTAASIGGKRSPSDTSWCGSRLQRAFSKPTILTKPSEKVSFTDSLCARKTNLQQSTVRTLGSFFGLRKSPRAGHRLCHFVDLFLFLAFLSWFMQTSQT